MEYKFPMTVLYEDGTMGHLRWDKQVVGLAFYSPVCSFGLGGGRYCIFDLKDMPAEISLSSLHQERKNLPHVLDWMGLNIDQVSQTLAMLQEDGYDVDPISPDKFYKALHVNVDNDFGSACVREVIIDLERRRISPSEGITACQRPCRYWYT